MARDDDFEEVVDVEPRMLIEHAYAAWRSAKLGTGASEPMWAELADPPADVWLMVSAVAIQKIDGADGLPWKDLAQTLYEAYCDGLQVNQPWANIARAEQLVWEAVGRHLANCMAVDDIRVADMESQADEWKSWVATKLEAEGVQA
jgi:hypothetical protein